MSGDSTPSAGTNQEQEGFSPGDSL